MGSIEVMVASELGLGIMNSVTRLLLCPSTCECLSCLCTPAGVQNQLAPKGFNHSEFCKDQLIENGTKDTSQPSLTMRKSVMAGLTNVVPWFIDGKEKSVVLVLSQRRCPGTATVTSISPLPFEARFLGHIPDCV